MISLLRTVFYKAPKVPDAGQRVLLLDDTGWQQGYRAVSGPITSETGEVVILVADEEEFRAARWDNRFADGFPWPVAQMTVPRRDEQRAKRRARRASRRAFNKSNQGPPENENGQEDNARNGNSLTGNVLNSNGVNGNGLDAHTQNSHNGNDQRG